MRKPFTRASLAAAFALSLPVFAEWDHVREAFLRQMADPVAENRVQSVRSLTGFDHPDGMALLLSAYAAEEDSDVRHALADAMNASTNVRARDVFRDTILKHPEERARARFCAVFADERMLDRVEMLRFLMRDPGASVRARACRNLGPRDSFLLRDVALLLKDPAVEVRMAASQGLGVLRSMESVERLIEALEAEENREVRWGLADALAKVSGVEHTEDPAVWRTWWAEHRTDGMGPVDKALARSSDWLKPVFRRGYESVLAAKQGGAGAAFVNGNSGLALQAYALWHAGVPESDPAMKEALDYLMEFRPQMTYESAIAAMAMADIGTARFRAQLVEIGQFLCDTQCANGQWSYGNWTRNIPTRGGKTTSSGGNTPARKPGGTEAQQKKTQLANRSVQRNPSGDNSNTQYGLLGLRAAATVCEVPNASWQRSLEWFSKRQTREGGWGYGAGGVDMAYESMTVSGLASIHICLNELGLVQGKPGAGLNAPVTKKALEWMEKNWEQQHAGGFGGSNYYCIYGIERAGMILGINAFGKHDWYEEGKTWLLANQLPTGAWGRGVGIAGGETYDTCFAILFLKKATKGYTVSGPATDK
ncbi:MAG: HEAT repeat domain-containing protein [Candidatus Brocadiae bacterium]|nr:HEAT repeat domain-containing protein [Candidatus Brocadiia bacterium]